jgi:hypothetical protein
MQKFWGIGARVVAVLAAITPAVGQVRYPDLRVIVPTDRFVIAQTQTGREFRYTHDTFNGGAAPLAIQPFYNSASGNYQGRQYLYTLNGSTWSIAQTIPVAGAFVFHAAHGHFHFPLTAFGLYAVAAGGGIGAPVAISPKNGFCIVDSFIYDSTLPNAGAFGNWGSCSDPTSFRGLSIGAVDEYDLSDPGQSIPINGLPDGTYWFRAMADPYNYLAESDETNNETDVKINIAGNTVQVLQTVVPVSPPLPTVAITSPSNGASLSGIVNLVASTSSGTGVQFLVDGQPLGQDVSPAGNTSWDTTGVPNGTHWLAAQTTDSNGRTNTSAVTSVTVANGTPPGNPGLLRIDSSISFDGHGTVSVPVTTTTANTVLIAFVAAGGPTTPVQAANVNGAGLAWTLIRRSNAQNGTAEIWAANSTNILSGATITSTLANATFDQSLTVVVFTGALGVGASAANSGSGGPPQVSLISTQPGSWTFGVGNDWDAATTRVTGQTMLHQWTDTSAADTFWVQSQPSPVATAGTTVTISDIGPTLDRWNLVAVEVLPVGPPPPDVTPPTVQLTNPVAGSTVAGTITIAATATDNQSALSITFYLDNAPLGAAVTTPPYTISWNTKLTTDGTHVLTANAVDAAGNIGVATSVSVTVDNSHPPNLIGKEVTVFTDGQGTMTTPPISTSTAGTLLVAFVAYDGPANSLQSAAVSGAGLTWSLVQRSNIQPGTAEIWAARVTGTLSNVTVTAQPVLGGSYHGSLTVTAFTNAAGTGIVGRASAPTGPPDIYLPGIEAGNWVFAVGNDWDRAVARTPVGGQVLVQQRVDTQVGDTFWVQSTAMPSAADGIVTIHDDTPTNDQWNYAAVEIVATRTTATWAISGTITPLPGGSGVTVTLNTTPTRTITTDTSGAYSFTGLANGSYTVTPSKTGFTFSPESQAPTINNGNAAGINFTANAVPTWAISGTITPLPGGSGVTVTLNTTPTRTITTDSSGAYSFTGLANGSYTVTPSETGFTFSPINRSVTVNNGNIGGVNFTATSSPPPTSISIDATVWGDGSTAKPTISTAAFSTISGNELLLAFIATDYVSGSNTVVTSVTGAGLTWVLVVRTNGRPGTAEIWRAFAPSALNNVTVTASLSQSVSSSMTVMSFRGINTSGTNGSGAIGAIGRGSGVSGAPAATLVTTRNNSWVLGVGNDYDRPIARTVGSGQTLVHQYMPPVGDTYWVQMRTSPTPVSGTSVTINDTAPTGDQYNLSICEIVQ